MSAAKMNVSRASHKNSPGGMGGAGGMGGTIREEEQFLSTDEPEDQASSVSPRATDPARDAPDSAKEQKQSGRYPRHDEEIGGG